MIRVETAAGIATVTLDRPDRRNAMSQDLVDQLIAFLERNAETGEARAILLVGAGRGFCAGSDLAGLAGMDDAGREAFEAASGRVARMLMAHPAPIVAAVSGFAIGGGLTLATSCDIVVTDPAAKWSLPEVPIGLFPAWGLHSVVERVGPSVARRLSFGIDTLDGAEAQRLGLADIVSATPLETAQAIAAKLAALPAAQVAATKRYFASDAAGEDADARANAVFMAATGTDEARASFVKFGSK